MSKLGRYNVIRPIAKGGMGEVLLVFDPVCERPVALKKIRDDLKDKKAIRERLYREAKLTSQLTHPGIITIYTIHESEEELYYTMPYVEGKTLKQLLRSKENSISSLLPIFKSVAQTIAYAHSKGILHRDLKPENILIGNFGEVVILDWGLAEPLEGDKKSDENGEAKESDLTMPGKIVGTLAYLAPERALGAPATAQSDIYSLGIILYQILTLKLPFERPTLKEFRERWHLETLQEPEDAAPYRDVPLRLSRIAKRSLMVKPEERYSSVDEMIADLTSYMEGRAEWFEMAKLNLAQKSDWEFQEHLLLSKHMAIGSLIEEPEWVFLSASNGSFTEPLRLETTITLGKEGSGIGFLFNIPEKAERESPFDGHLIWLGNDERKLSTLYRNGVEVTQIPDLFLQREKKHHLIIEKIEKSIRIIIDGVPRFTYLSYLPLSGTHVGVMSRDSNFETSEIALFVGSTQLQVSCLAIPDGFLAAKDYKRALAEYRRIATSFPGHVEGREALFRAGITLLEEAKGIRSAKKALITFTTALEEFSKLHQTPGAPLEYLGKSLVYQALSDREEEVKCLELALRRYKDHPLVDAIKERILYRMHESASKDRLSAYELILISLRHLPEVLEKSEAIHLFRHLIAYNEKLPFFESPLDPSLLGREPKATLQFAIELAFWAALPFTLLELFDEALALDPFDPSLIGNILFAFLVLGAFAQAENLIVRIQEKRASLSDEIKADLDHLLLWLSPILIAHREKSLKNGIATLFKLKKENLGVRELRTALFLMEEAITEENEEEVEEIASAFSDLLISKEDQLLIDGMRIWAALKQKNIEKAEELFDRYPPELLNQESTLLNPLYGCFLLLTEGLEMSNLFFAGVVDTPFPRSWALLGHEITNHILDNPSWSHTAFLYEKRMLYRELILYYSCLKNPDEEARFRELEKQQYLRLPD